ncbi:MAG: hypothetical protein GY816_20810, partial [Cytophagales bacterium]|nr:hypothetical protein [Cytophagales bacterium]
DKEKGNKELQKQIEAYIDEKKAKILKLPNNSYSLLKRERQTIQDRLEIMHPG